MTDLRPILDAIGACPDNEIDLADAALQLARIDAPDADWQAARAHLTLIARDAARLSASEPGADLMARADMLSDLLCDHYDYRGDIESYDDLANANLLRVIERRRGLPISLGIIWLHAANAAGWAAHGIDVPGHFVVALAEADPSRKLVLDVFDGGGALDAQAVSRLLRRSGVANDPRALRPMSSRAILMRLQTNIRLRRAAAGDLDGALACTEDTLRIAPNAAVLWREAAGLQERVGQVAAAMQSWHRFLALNPAGPDAVDARSAMDELRSRLN